MSPQKIYNPENGLMRVACFVSGSGSNARRIIERSLEGDSRYKVVLIFTDVRDDRTLRDGSKMCNAKDIAAQYGIGYESEDIRDFYREKNLPRSDLSVRPEFDDRVIANIDPYRIDLICNAGYMSIMTTRILDVYSGRIINVHPADLTITEGKERKYVGIHVVEEAIMAGETELRSTTHVVREKVDHGEILVVSPPIPVELPEAVTLENLREDKSLRKRVVDENQSRLKRSGDWVIYPLTVQLIGEGKFSLNGRGNVFYEGKRVPMGLRLPGD
jgi:phosphoribosylglycinamide formyltransferase-1